MMSRSLACLVVGLFGAAFLMLPITDALAAGCPTGTSLKIITDDGGGESRECMTPIGKREGPWTWYYPNGDMGIEGSYRNNKRHGKYTSWYENGQKHEEGEYRNGKKRGKWPSWHENGQKYEEGEYKDGKKHGEKHGKWTIWHKNGKKKAEGEYRDGKKHGKWTFRLPTGEIEKVLQCNMGRCTPAK